MTRADAATLLGVAESATVSDVRRAYEALHNDFQIRLTNAPTPALKKTYQQKLQDLSVAGETLHPGFAAGTIGGDLPSAEPMIADVRTRRTSGMGTASDAEVSRSEARTRAPGQAAAEQAGLPRSTVVAAVAAVVLGVALSLVGLRHWSASSRLETLAAERTTLEEQLTVLKAQTAAVDRLLFADRLRVRNLSQNPVRISAAAFVYRDSAGEMKLAHSGNFDYPSWEIRPGGVSALDAEMARGRLWDGPVIYYALLVEYQGVEPFLKAGVWAQDIDRLDKVVTLDLD